MHRTLPLSCLILSLFSASCQNGPEPALPAEPEYPFDRVEPRRYVCYRAEQAPAIDGRLDEEVWRAAQRTEAFVDIEGETKATPRFVTRACMLWDEECFYIGAELDEPHLWATLTERDSVIFQDNDFEVFIDPDGDTHLYFELEINALGTEWDLLLVKPYRDGGPAIHAWDMPGLRSAVHLDGTLNDPSDVDGGWSLEIAIPWAAIREAAGREAPPVDGDIWWVDFSRVEWQTVVEDGRHVKVTDPKTGKPLPENNWVWSPQGVINMHRPETWGRVMFSEETAGPGAVGLGPPPNQSARFALRRVYEAQRLYHEEYGRYAAELDALGLADPGLAGWGWPPRIAATPSQYEVFLEKNGGGGLRLTQDGRLQAVDR